MCSPTRLPPEWLTPEQRERQARQWLIYATVLLCGFAAVVVGAFAFLVGALAHQLWSAIA